MEIILSVCYNKLTQQKRGCSYLKNCIRGIGQKALACALAAAISSSSLCGMPFTVNAGETGTESGAEAGVGFERADGQGVVYTLTPEGDCYVSGYSELIGASVRIPAEIEMDGGTYRVKGIRAGAFEGCADLESVRISNSITEIEDGIFQGCGALKEIFVEPDETTVKTSGKTSAVTLKIDSGLFDTPAGVKLEIGMAVIDKAVSGKKTDQVTLKVLVAAGSSSADGMPESIVLQKEAVKALADSKKSLLLQVRDVSGGSYYVRVKAEDLKKVKGNLPLAVCMKEVEDTSGTLNEDLKKVFRKNGSEAGDAEIFSYNFEKGSGTTVSLTIPAEDVKGAKPGGGVYVYRYDKNKRVFVSTSLHPYTVSENGNIKLTVSRGGTFVVTKKEFQAMSRKPASEFVTEGKAVYYAGKDGEPVRGWRKIGGEYYYFDRESGRMASGKKVDGVKLADDGTAEQTDAATAKIRTMIKARALYEKITEPGDSLEQKREKCFRWVFQFPYRRYRLLEPIYKEPGWEVTFANDIFDHQQGCCVSDAAAVAFLFRECGYEEVYVACDTSHAWVELEGRVYDPLFAEARGFKKYYNIPYSSYYASKPVLKRKI